MNRKIFTIEELGELLPRVRSHKTVALCHGVFDLLHPGHIRHFDQAKSQCDILIVTLTEDRFVNKGPDRPAFHADLRAEAVAALESVDYVAINRWPTAAKTIALLAPDLFVKGSEYSDARRDVTGKIIDEEAAILSCGGKMMFTDGITFSSSTLLNSHFSPFDEDVRAYILGISQNHGIEYVTGLLESAEKLRVLVVGETIIDEYFYCETLGKSGKEPILAAKYVGEERFSGGIQAIANHVASFCAEVESVSCLGSRNSHESFIRERLHENVRPHFITLDDAPTLVKRRFVETYPFQKLFEIYEIGEEEAWRGASEALSEKLQELIPQFDLVIVADYGHGMLDRKTIELLTSHARFLAVNTQVNAGNHGFNTISKYSRADFISISENELRIDARSRQRPIEELVLEVSAKLDCPRIIITSGKQGLLCYAEKEGFSRAPALTNHVVDRVGAGDALLAIVSLCVVQGAPIEVAGFIGNVVGAQAVGMVCNQKAIDRIGLLKHITAVLR